MEGRVEQLKAKANARFAAKSYQEAAALYTEAIDLDGTNAVLYSNRCAALLQTGDMDGALSDAKRCVELKPEWDKAWYRLGCAHEMHGNTKEAMMAFGICCIMDGKGREDALNKMTALADTDEFHAFLEQEMLSEALLFDDDNCFDDYEEDADDGDFKCHGREAGEHDRPPGHAEPPAASPLADLFACYGVSSLAELAALFQGDSFSPAQTRAHASLSHTHATPVKHSKRSAHTPLTTAASKRAIEAKKPGSSSSKKLNPTAPCFIPSSSNRVPSTGSQRDAVSALSAGGGLPGVCKGSSGGGGGSSAGDAAGGGGGGKGGNKEPRVGSGVGGDGGNAGTSGGGGVDGDDGRYSDGDYSSGEDDHPHPGGADWLHECDLPFAPARGGKDEEIEDNRSMYDWFPPGLPHDEAYEWFVDCYRLRADDDYAYDYHFRGLYLYHTEKKYGLETNRRQPHNQATVLKDFLLFCVGAQIRKLLQEQQPWWDWGALVSKAMGMLPYALDEGDAKKRWGADLYDMRVVGAIIYGGGPLRLTPLDKHMAELMEMTHEHSSWKQMKAMFHKVGGIQIWVKLRLDIPDPPDPSSLDWTNYIPKRQQPQTQSCALGRSCVCMVWLRLPWPMYVFNVGRC